MRYMHMILSLLASASIFYNVSCQKLDWDYLPEGDKLTPDLWHSANGNCAGKGQSPIAVNMGDIVAGVHAPPLSYSASYHQPISQLLLANLGKTLQAFVQGEGGPQISGGLMGNSTYDLLQLHLHWGPTNSEGSEHILDDRPASLELHLVHRKVGLTTEQALQDPSGLAVLALLYHASSSSSGSNAAMKNITDYASRVEFMGEEYPLPPLNVMDMLPSDGRFLSYMGSLTAPPCSQSVIWSIFTEIQPISNQQMLDLRNLKRTEKSMYLGKYENFLSYNFRPVQNRNGRIILSNG